MFLPIINHKVRTKCCSQLSFWQQNLHCFLQLRKKKTHQDLAMEFFCPLLWYMCITPNGLRLFDINLSCFSPPPLSTAEGFFSRSSNSTVTGWETFLQALGYFLNMFFGSAALGTLTGLISSLVSTRTLSSATVIVLLLCAFVYLNSLTQPSVSQTLWPEKDSFAGVWHDDNICVPSLRPGWRHQVIRWV